MFRMRRYRVFIIFAVIAVGALYHFTTIGEFENAGAASVEGLKNFGQKIESAASAPPSEPDAKDSPDIKNDHDTVTLPNPGDSEGPKRILSFAQGPEILTPSPTTQARPSSKDDSPDLEDRPIAIELAKPALKSPPANKTSKVDTGLADPVINPIGGDGRKEIIEATTQPKIHWSQLPEHFPVPTQNIIQLPTGKPKAIPRIQYAFKDESVADKASREEKLDIIKNAFTFSWGGYKKKAWMHDELSPISGKHRNPFCGWGATLVDTLDTLWIMDLKEDFEEAVEAVNEIDFTTSARNDIPLFETVIRYLGGLIAAFDISGGTYRVLLDKAVELADILMGSFDTPNRMPMTFYLWKPTFASQPHRAKTRVVLAELGSLSVEFTRLAQLTKEARYYDAIARITNEFEIWQNSTRLPGLWPIKVDTSGCRKPDVSQTHSDLTSMNGPADSKPLMLPDETAAGNHPNTVDDRPPKTTDPKEETKRENSNNYSIRGDSLPKNNTDNAGDIPSHKASMDSVGSSKIKAKDESNPAAATSDNGALRKRVTPEQYSAKDFSTPTESTPECEPQGLASPPFTSSEDFTIGGQADSTYEYLPKEYMLLGGLEDKYRTMYEMAADSTTKNLLYRPMIPDENRHVLNAGLVKVSGKDNKMDFQPEGTHLTCFAGGMYAVGAKIFNRDEDMDIAWKLTDGCVWAYESTATGIMPESYLAVACRDPKDCRWNETLWHEKLDPFGDSREQSRLAHQQVVLDGQKNAASKDAAALPQAEPAKPLSDAPKEQKVDSQRAGMMVEGPESRILADKVGMTKDPRLEETTSKDDHQASQERAEKAISMSAIKEVEQPQSETLDEAAEFSVAKPTEGATLPKKAVVRRQLGEVEEAPSITRQVEPPNNIAGAPKSRLADTAEPMTEKTTAEQHLEASNPISQHTKAKEPASEQRFGDVKTKTQILEDQDTLSRLPNGTAKSPAAYTPPPIPTREEFVAARIRDERLPKGMTKVTGGRYLLRPEAIESVFIMYRASGDAYWREKGWDMFRAIERHTIATYGASAIQDVTSEKAVGVDEMESFWLAETLKYFFLLFSDPSLVSLDDYVLNTEAHAFKRPN